MSRESAKAKYTRLPGDPEVGYISPDDVMDAIDIMATLTVVNIGDSGVLT